MSDLNSCHGATDIFNMEAISADFHVQDSSTNHAVERVDVRSKTGGVACTFSDVNGMTQYSATYDYCGSTLATHMDVLLATFGAVRDSKLIDSVTISWSASRPPQITINGHNHDDNAHDALTNPPTTFDASGLLTGATGGVGTFDLLGLGAVDTCTSTATLTISLEHTDYNCGDGNHGVGVSTNATAEGVVEYVGNVDETALVGWTYVSSDYSDSNSDVCKETVTAYKQLDAN